MEVVAGVRRVFALIVSDKKADNMHKNSTRADDDAGRSGRAILQQV